MKDGSNINIHTTNDHNHHMIKQGMLAGFIASAVSSLVLIALTSLILIPEFDFVSIQGSLFGLAGTATSAWLVYFIIGTFVWGTFYSFLEEKLSGEGPVSKGVLFGFLVWIIVMAVLMPLAGEGFFLMQKYGYTAAGIVFLTDLVFGVTTAYFYKKLCRG